MVERKPYLSARIGVNHLRGLRLLNFERSKPIPVSPRFGGKTTCEGCFFLVLALWFVKPIKPGFMVEQNHTCPARIGVNHLKRAAFWVSSGARPYPVSQDLGVNHLRGLLLLGFWLYAL